MPVLCFFEFFDQKLNFFWIFFWEIRIKIFCHYCHWTNDSLLFQVSWKGFYPAEVEGLERLESSKFSLEETILISVHFGGFTRLYAVRLRFWLKCLKRKKKDLTFGASIRGLFFFLVSFCPQFLTKTIYKKAYIFGASIDSTQLG